MILVVLSQGFFWKFIINWNESVLHLLIIYPLHSELKFVQLKFLLSFEVKIFKILASLSVIMIIIEKLSLPNYLSIIENSKKNSFST